MSDISIEKLIQREKWREAKARWRAKKAKEPVIEKAPGKRRHSNAKLTLDEEGLVFRDYLQGDSYRVLCARYSLSTRTVTKILYYWKSLCDERFTSSSLVEEEPQQEAPQEFSSGGFF